MSTLSSQIANLSPEQLAKLAYELKANKARRQERRKFRSVSRESLARSRLRNSASGSSRNWIPTILPTTAWKRCG